MFLMILAFCVGWLLAMPAYGESLPSFDLSQAARHATDIVVVEEGKIVEVWKGRYRVGDRWEEPLDAKPREVEHALTGADVELLKKEIEARGLTFVTRVSGKRQVLFRVRDELLDEERGLVNSELAEERALARRGLRSDPVCSTIWIEAGQAFAEQQYFNPGPSAVASVDEILWNRESEEYERVSLTYDQLKQAVVEWIALDHDYLKAAVEKDVTRRRVGFLKLLRSEDHRRTMFAIVPFPNNSQEVWPLARPMLENPRQMDIHAELIWVLYNRASPSHRREIMKALDRILTEEPPANADPDAQRHDRRRKKQANSVLQVWGELVRDTNSP